MVRLVLATATVAEPGRRGRDPLGLMFELRLLAREVLATPDPTTGRATGLPFEYAPLGV